MGRLERLIVLSWTGCRLIFVCGPKSAEITDGGRSVGLGTGCTGGGPAAGVNDVDFSAEDWWQCAFGVFHSKRFSTADVTVAAPTPEQLL